MGKLNGKNILLTGGSSGIGKATLDLFVEEGASTIFLADYDAEGGQAVQDQYPDCVVFIKTDVGVVEEVDALFDEIAASGKQLDIVFNNAGVGGPTPTHELDFSEWRRTLSIDLDGLFLISQKAIQVMLDQGQGGSIVQNASMYGHVGAATSAAYTAAKGGVVNLTRTLGLEYAEDNIRVNVLCPGFVDTPILADDIREGLIAATPMKRLGKPEEVAKAALFLASDDSSFMTGASLIVDGGYTAG